MHNGFCTQMRCRCGAQLYVDLKSRCMSELHVGHLHVSQVLLLIRAMVERPPIGIVPGCSCTYTCMCACVYVFMYIYIYRA